MAAPVINQKEYLKKYLSGPKKDKKKKSKGKKKDSSRFTSRTQVIDDDVTLRKLDELGCVSEEEYGEDAPQVAEIVDERPTHMQGKWKTLDDRNEERNAFQSNLSQGKKGKDKDDFSLVLEQSDDLSPPRHKNNHDSDSIVSRPQNRERHDSDSDMSPPRHMKRHDSDSDMSPPRHQKRHDSGVSHPRYRKRHDSDSDVSPPRHQRRHDSEEDESPPRHRKRHDSDSDISPPRHQKKHNSNMSPPRHQKRRDSDVSPPRHQQRHDSDSDISLPRHQKRHGSEGTTSRHKSKKTHDSNSVSSPSGRRQRHDSGSTISHPRSSKSHDSRGRRMKHDTDSDVSPPRSKKRHGSGDASSTRSQKSASNVKRHESQTDRNRSELSPSRNRRDFDSDSDTSLSRHGRKQGNAAEVESKKRSCPEETLSGLRSGLQGAGTLRDELQAAKEREKKLLESMGSQSGRDAETVFRDHKTGKKRDLKEERRQKRKELEKMAEQQEKYLEWGRGVKQTAEKQNQLEQDLYEMSKPLARYQDDPDLEKHLKEQEREGDPMLEFVRKRRSKQNPKQTVRPTYKGPPAPPNRFGILPGYRWDGVDRSNGFEKKFFERTSNKVANQEEAYKWSISDM